MRIINTVLFCGCVLLVSLPSYGVTKCVVLNSSTTCSSSTQTGVLDWSSTCTTNGVRTTIRGVSGCASQSGGSNELRDSINTSGYGDDNKHCWCRMISPAVSKWIFSYSYGSGGECDANCGANCAGTVQEYDGFRSTMMSNLSN